MNNFLTFVNIRTSLVFLLIALLPAVAWPQNSDSLPPRSLVSILKWRSIGPYIGGRVIAVTGVPGNDNLFYAGAVGGGLWKSTDNGLEWGNITDGKLPGASSSIGAVAVAPSDPSTIYIGTGESDIRGDLIAGDGVYKSTDAGKTWQFAGLRDARFISTVVVDPHNPKVVYVASMGHVFAPDPNRGIFKSTDGGKTWKKILFVDNKTGAIDLVMDPSHPDVMYASMWQAQRTPWGLVSGGPGSGIYKTTDGGSHWTNITRNPGLPKGVLGRMGLSIADSNPNIVYAIIQAKEGGVFRSDDAGATWKRVNQEMKIRQRAFYYMTIYADPKDPDTVYAPNVDALWVSHDGGKTFNKLRPPHGDNHSLWINPHDTRILLEGNDGGATVSTDGGKTWSTVNNQPTGQFYHVNIDNRFPYHIFGAQQDEGSYEGTIASSDGVIPLSAWHAVAFGESTWTVPQPESPRITYGSGYYSIFLKYNQDTEEFRSVSPWPQYTDGASSGALKYRFAWTHPILFSPVNPKQLFTAAQYVFESNDHGATWDRISPDLTRNLPETKVPTGGPIDLDQTGAEIYPSISALAVSPLDGKVIWAGSQDGLVHVTTDGGKTWKKVTPPALPRITWISSIEPSHKDGQTAYLTAQRYMLDDYRPYVFKTTDLGRHWTAITTGLPKDQFVYSIKQDPNEPKLLFLGTRSTVYYSLDDGQRWRPLTLNLPVAEVRGIAISTRQGQVVAATHGRAFWVLDNLTFLEQLAAHPAVQADASYLFAPEQAWLTHSYGGLGSDERRPPSAGTNPPFGATVFFHIPQSYSGKTPASLQFIDAQGKVVRDIQLHLATAEQKKQKEEAFQGEGAGYLPSSTSKPDHSEETSVQKIQKSEAQLSAIDPGMNRLQWNLRYPYATEVNGFHTPIAAGGMEDTVDGPVVVPGTYSVVLNYGGHKSTQSLTVRLDPRLHATQQDLEARLALDLQIHADLDKLDKTVNRALDARDKLEKMLVAKQTGNTEVANLLAALDRDIDSAVQMAIDSSEGDVLHETKLRSQLATLAKNIDLSYGRPNAAHYAVFKELHEQAAQVEQKLEADLVKADQFLSVDGHND